MFFEEQDFSACVTDVISFNERKKAVVPTAARSFYALSFRHTADTYFKTDNEVVEVSSHSIALVPANIQYTRVAQNESMTVIHFTPSRELGNKIKVFYPDNYIEYEKCFYKILKVWQRKDVAYKIKCNEYFMRLVYLICCDADNEQNENIAALAARMIEKNLSDYSFGVADIADAFDISGVYLRKKFNDEYGVSPCEYLAEKRMEKAVTLLETNYFSIKEVAMRCGFENEKYFSTVFKKHFGVSPSKF